MQDGLKIVVYKEDDMLIAQCLEYDICTQAEDRETLRERMDCLINLELDHMKDFGQELDPAPERFHNMWPEDGNHVYKEVAA
ncbi:MAG: hypothetical protein RID90_15970 [Marinovum algicola]